MQIKNFQLSEDENQVLSVLARSGAMSPSRLSAETLILPGKTLELLKGLVENGFVVIRDSKESADGMLVALTPEARDFFEFSSTWQVKR
ncbi:MAG: MarR family winged helix-turn-helix transcriptional regulator [Chloroflexota bacterium]